MQKRGKENPLEGLTEAEIAALGPLARNLIVTGVRLEAPRFYVVPGRELGAHWHLFETIGQKDTGVVITSQNGALYIENHGNGHHGKHFNITAIGNNAKADLVIQLHYQLPKITPENCRRPGKSATLLISRDDYTQVVKQYFP